MSYQNNKDLISFKDVEISISDIIDINPRTRMILLSYDDKYDSIAHNLNDPLIKNGMIAVISDGVIFSRIKFLYIKHIKTHPIPEHRVADFEFRDKNGVADFDKLERLIDKRKTRQEKQRELDDEITLKEAFDDANMPYHGPLRMA